MANIKSAKKRISVIKKKTEINKSAKSKMKTSIRKFNEACLAGDKDVALRSFLEAEKTIRKTASKGTIHKNAADRRVSRLAKKLASLA
ncbi:30S ribosomal protein S20 [Guggenheimella bovis]